MQKLIIANWKMNGSLELMESFSNNLKINKNAKIIICPPTHLLSTKVNFTKGAQDISALHPTSGAFTGEVSGSMLQSVDCKYVLIGHSERREYFRETSQTLTAKLKNAIQNNLIPVFCFGEKLEDFNNNQTLNVIEHQLSILKEIDIDIGIIVLAYEPVWSIGTGLVPKISDISKVYDFIHKKFAEKAKIVYGGSVNSGNAKEILSSWPVEGVLVGGASLKIGEFQQIIDFA